MIRASNATVAIVLIAAASTLYAGTLDLPSFRIDLPDDWTYSVEAKPDSEWGDVFVFRHADDDGYLKIMSYETSVAITKDRLRRMTNIDERIPLAWQTLGDFSGYQYAYEERGTFYCQWFLVNGQTLLLVTYQGDPVSKERIAEDLDRIIRSLTTNPPPVR